MSDAFVCVWMYSIGQRESLDYGGSYTIIYEGSLQNCTQTRSWSPICITSVISCLSKSFKHEQCIIKCVFE